MVAVTVAITIVEALVGIILAVILASFRLLPPIIHAIIVDNHVGTKVMFNPIWAWAPINTVRMAWAIALTTDTLSMTFINAPLFTFTPVGAGVFQQATIT